MHKLTLILGPMFASKSYRFIEMLERERIAKKNILVLKPDIDNRSIVNMIITHNGMKLDCNSVDIDLQKIKIADTIEVIGIDEGQFFKNLLQFVYKQLSSGKDIIISALNSDYNRQNFGEITALIPLAEDIIKLNSVCSICGKVAPFSFKKNPKDSNKIVVGGEDIYEARCWKCWKQGVDDSISQHLLDGFE